MYVYIHIYIYPYIHRFVQRLHTHHLLSHTYQLVLEMLTDLKTLLSKLIQNLFWHQQKRLSNAGSHCSRGLKVQVTSASVERGWRGGNPLGQGRTCPHLVLPRHLFRCNSISWIVFGQVSFSTSERERYLFQVFYRVSKSDLWSYMVNTDLLPATPSSWVLSCIVFLLVSGAFFIWGEKKIIWGQDAELRNVNFLHS